MASLRDVVSEYQDDLRNGIAWLALWRIPQCCSCSENEGPQKTEKNFGIIVVQPLTLNGK